MKQIKCPNCGHWTHAGDKHCLVCASEIRDIHKEEREERARHEKNSLPIIEIPEDDPPLQKLWKRPVQIAQLIFFSVISLIAAIASSTVH